MLAEPNGPGQNGRQPDGVGDGRDNQQSRPRDSPRAVSGFECEAAAIAASRNNPDEIAAIREAFEAMRAASSGQGDPVLSDAAFHEAVLAATGNRFFLPLSALIHTALQYSVPTTNALFGHPVGDLDAHGKVLKAIESGDSTRARKAMHDMLSEVLARVRTAAELTGAG
ncbi:FadR/GntR family transcriptional regulator [Mesorhizobium sp.]|uniref:FadR/GntR family transcriptional regulator n=1 Tax=Mesorhizobium sp. TaxID=1871066 RepID=UPI0025FD39D8|nr:FCD domain-containing protein [Mesorhizobium sp.]